MIATFVPEPGPTPVADAYREIVDAFGRDVDLDAFDPREYDPISVRAARAHWQKRMVDEYASTTVFSGLYAQLVEANASLDMGAVVLRMAQDELRHAEICGRVALRMGGTNRVQRDTTVRPLAIHPGCSPEERALRNVLVTSVSEMHSVAFFVASLDRMEDASIRSVTRSLLSDEILHGRFGFYYLQAWSEWLAARPEVRASISRYLRHVFAVCERELVCEPSGRPPGADDDRLGLVSNELGREIFLSTMEEAIVPALERFGLDATRVWRTRTIS